MKHGHRSVVVDPQRCDETGKVKMSRDTAGHAARNLNGRQKRDRWPVHAFRCLSCGAYHTGHVPNAQRRHG